MNLQETPIKKLLSNETKSSTPTAPLIILQFWLLINETVFLISRISITLQIIQLNRIRRGAAIYVNIFLITAALYAFGVIMYYFLIVDYGKREKQGLIKP